MANLSRRSMLTSAPAAVAATALGAAPSAAASRNLPLNRSHPLEGVGREKLKITDVKVTLLSCELPPDKRWVTGRSETWKTDGILVEVFTDQGIVGIGEPSPYGGPERVKQYIDEVARPLLLGKNPFDVEYLTPFWGSGVFGPQVAWAGIDVALWDIIGKAKGLPVWKLLATDSKPNPHIRMYASGGVEYAWYRRPEDLIDEAVRKKEEGYTAFKLRIGTEWRNSGVTVAKFSTYLRKLREAVGPKMDLMQEANMRLTLEQCLELCPVLEDLKFLWFEEPVRRFTEQAIDQHLKIREALKTVKVSGGETMMTRFEFKPWLDRGAYDIAQPDMNTTGITEGWHIARMAHVRGRYCCPHNWHGGLTTMSNAALVAAIPNHLVLELNQTFNPLKEEIFVEPLVVKKGFMDLPDKPGYGVEVIKDAARKFPFIPGRYDHPNPNLPPV